MVGATIGWSRTSSLTYAFMVYTGTALPLFYLCRARVCFFIKFRVSVCEPRVLCFDSSTYNFTSENFIFSRFWRTAGSEAFQLTLGATSTEITSALAAVRKSLALLNRLTPNDPYMGRTAPLTSKRCIFIYLFNKYRY